MAGAPVGGVALPLVAPRIPSPRKLIDGLTGPARRSIVAKLFMGDLDIAAYSGNWDLRGHAGPSRACAYCLRRWCMDPFVEDEWHVLLICPLYEHIRRPLRLKAQAIRVEGHALQGDGCSQRNLIQLLRVMMLHPRFVAIADFPLQAMKRRRQFRQNLYTGPYQWSSTCILCKVALLQIS